MALFRCASGGSGGAEFLTRDKGVVRTNSVWSYTLPFSTNISNNSSFSYLINTTKYNRITIAEQASRWKLYDLTGNIPNGLMSSLAESPVQVDGVWGWDVSNKNLVLVVFSNYSGGTVTTGLDIE